MKQKFIVKGMSCTACSSAVERAVKKIDGVSNAVVSLTSETLVVEGEFTNVAVIKAVKNAGFKCFVYSNNTADKSTSIVKTRLIPSIILLVVLMYFAMGQMLKLPFIPFLKGVEGALYLASIQLVLALSVIIINFKFFINGVKAVIKLSPNMDTLIAVGSGASFLFGVFAFVMIIIGTKNSDSQLVKTYIENLYFDSSAMILTLVTLGKYLEDKSKRKTESAVQKLKSLAPNTAVVLVDGVEKEISVSSLKVGDVIVVKKGQSVPADAVVLSGEGDFNEANLTGESLPVFKTYDAEIKTATVCISGYLTARVTACGSDTVFSKIIDYVLSAEATKAPVQRIADTISRIFVPAVVIISIITLVVWLLIGKPFDFAFSRAVSVLVVSCPCALGLATPVAVTVATGKCASFGVLIKNAEVLEQIGLVNTVLMDKTGTLTKGKLHAGKVHYVSEQELIEIASIEKFSEHPIGDAIVSLTSQPLLEISGFVSVTGKGVKGTVNGNNYLVGNKAFVALCDMPVEIESQAEVAISSGKSVVFASKNNKVIGFFEISDQIKPSAKDAINSLKELQIKTVILSGDNKVVTETIKNEVGADIAYGEVLPEDKANVVKDYKNYGKVMFVGDGVNDSPAITVADVGVSIGEGTDIAVSSSNVILLSTDLTSIAKAVKTGKKARKIIKQNLFWAFIYNVIGIPLASGVFYFLGVLLNPMIASLFMSISSLFVVTNALRIYKS